MPRKDKTTKQDVGEGLPDPAPASCYEVVAQKVASRMQDAFMGYAKYNVTHSTLIFSKINSRRPQEAECVRLTKSFLSRGPLKAESPIPIVLELSLMHPNCIAKLVQSIPANIDDLVYLEMAQDHEQDDKIAAAGAYRAEAIKRVRKYYDNKIEKLSKKFGKLPIASEMTETDMRRQSEIVGEITVLKGQKAEYNVWTVALYNEAKLRDTLGKKVLMKLASNVVLYRMRETDDEALANIGFQLLQVRDPSYGSSADDTGIQALLEEYISKEYKDNAAVRTLLGHPASVELLMRFCVYDHFRYSSIFNSRWLTTNIFHVAGGIIAHHVQKGLQSLDILSTASDFAFSDDMRTKMKELRHASEEQTRDILGQKDAWDEQVSTGVQLQGVMTSSLLDHIDNLYVEIVQPYNEAAFAASAHAGDWTKKVHTYSRKVGEYLREHASAVLSEHHDSLESTSDFHKVYASLHGKFLYLSLPGPDGRVSPLMTASFVKDLAEMYSQVGEALKEVVRWIEPLVDYNIGSGRHNDFNWRDYTMALTRHLDESEALSSVKNNVVEFLIEHRATTLAELQLDIVHLGWQERPKTAPPEIQGATKELLSSLKAKRPWQPRQTYDTKMEYSFVHRTIWPYRISNRQKREMPMVSWIAVAESRLVAEHRPRLLERPAAAYMRAKLFDIVQGENPSFRWPDLLTSALPIDYSLPDPIDMQYRLKEDKSLDAARKQLQNLVNNIVSSPLTLPHISDSGLPDKNKLKKVVPSLAPAIEQLANAIWDNTRRALGRKTIPPHGVKIQTTVSDFPETDEESEDDTAGASGASAHASGKKRAHETDDSDVPQLKKKKIAHAKAAGPSEGVLKDEDEVDLKVET